MFRNYFLTAWRNLLKNKLFSVLNIFGLAIGMAVTLLIALWITDEVGFDTYSGRHGSIAQVMDVYGSEGEKATDPYIAIPLAGEVRNQCPADIKRTVPSSLRAGIIFWRWEISRSRPGACGWKAVFLICSASR